MPNSSADQYGTVERMLFPRGSWNPKKTKSTRWNKLTRGHLLTHVTAYGTKSGRSGGVMSDIAGWSEPARIFGA